MDGRILLAAGGEVRRVWTLKMAFANASSGQSPLPPLLKEELKVLRVLDGLKVRCLRKPLASCWQISQIPGYLPGEPQILWQHRQMLVAHPYRLPPGLELSGANKVWPAGVARWEVCAKSPWQAYAQPTGET